jgi:mono/diheme cytochrome c family protein
MAERRVALAAGALTVALAAVTTWAWTARSSTAVEPAPAAAGAAAPLAGADLFRAKGCASCHEGPGVRSVIGLAPSLAAVGDWPAERRRSMPLADYLRESILEPGAFASLAFSPSGPTTAMPGIAVSPAELDALVAYLMAE